MSWKAIPIFVSSTFRDMHDERDLLMPGVFQELDEWLRPRRCFIEPVDLRWGVDTTALGQPDAKERMVLKVCLDEIERARPFMIVLLGDRYGSVMHPERVREAAQEKGFALDPTDISVTALEAEFGLCSGAGHRAVVFVRELDYTGMSDTERCDFDDAYAAQHHSDPERRGQASRDAAALQRLKAKLGKVGGARCQPYPARWEHGRVVCLERFHEQVLATLKHELEQETAEREICHELSWQEMENWELEAFIDRHTRDLVPCAIVNELRTFAAQGRFGTEAPVGVCLTAPAGTGKSAVLSQLLKGFRQGSKPRPLVLAHAAGLTPHSASVMDLLQRWCDQLCAAAKQPSISLANLDEAKQILLQLLSAAAHSQSVLLLVDALDQLERTPAGRYVTWLPTTLPASVRFIVTATPGTESQVLSERPGVVVHELAPLSGEEPAKLVQLLRERYRKPQLNPRVTGALFAKRFDGQPAASNPLWLRSAVQQLLLIDRDDFEAADRVVLDDPGLRIAEHMVRLVDGMDGDVERLLVGLFARASQYVNKQLGVSWAGDLLDLLATSRAGLRARDLAQLIGAEPSEFERGFAVLRRYLREHLVERGEDRRWDFAHAISRQQLRNRMREAGVLRARHACLVRHLAGLPEGDELRATETMYHLMSADLTTEAAIEFGTAHGLARVAGTRTIAETIVATEPVDDATASATRGWEIGSLGDLSRRGRRLVPELSLAAGAAREDEPVLPRVLSMLDAARQTPSGDGLVKEVCHRLLFDLYPELEQRATLATLRALLDALSDCLAELATRGGADERLLHARLTVRLRTGQLLANVDLEAAVDEARRGLELSESLLGREPLDEPGPDLEARRGREMRHLRDIAMAHVVLGDALRQHRAAHDPIPHYFAAQEILEALSKTDPGNASYQLDWVAATLRLGDGHRDASEVDHADYCYGLALEAARDLNVGPVPLAVVRAVGLARKKLGDLRSPVDINAAKDHIEEALCVAQRLVETDPTSIDHQGDLILAWKSLGDLNRARGDRAAAQQDYERSRQLAQQLLARVGPNPTVDRVLSDLVESLAALQR